jgi:hypothetical protein
LQLKQFEEEKMLSVAEVKNYQPFIETDPQADTEELKSQLQANSYLFFRGLVPPEVVLEVRRAVLQICLEAGWIDPNYDLMEAVIAPGVVPTQEGKPDYADVYRKVLKTPIFHEFPNDPNLLRIAGQLLDISTEDILVHPRRIGRLTFPNNKKATTPPHQDYYYIRGSVDTYSCWIPLGECPVRLGGLAVMPGSHRGGYREHTVKFPGAVGGVGLPVDESTAVWHTTDFGLGDALFFHPYSIHKAMPNLTSDRLRISTDNRYQRQRDAIDPSALLPHAVINPRRTRAR